jgi:hypothetical protein
MLLPARLILGCQVENPADKVVLVAALHNVSRIWPQISPLPFYLALDFEARRKRFCSAVSDDAIEQHCRTLDFNPGMLRPHRLYCGDRIALPRTDWRLRHLRQPIKRLFSHTFCGLQRSLPEAWLRRYFSETAERLTVSILGAKPDGQWSAQGDDLLVEGDRHSVDRAVGFAPENCPIDPVLGGQIFGDSEVDPPDKLPFLRLRQQRVSEVPLELLYVIRNRCLTGSHENWFVGKHCFAIRFYWRRFR